MKKEEIMKKRFGALMLALVLAFSLAIPAGAAVIPGDGGIQPMILTNQTATGTIYVNYFISGRNYNIHCKVKTTCKINDYNSTISSISDVTKVEVLVPEALGTVRVDLAPIPGTKNISGKTATQRVTVTTTRNGVPTDHIYTVKTTSGSSVLEIT